MANASKDGNHVSTMVARSSDGTNTVVKVCSDIGNTLCVTTTGVASAEQIAYVRDENHVPVLTAVSSVDGVTPVEIYADALTGDLFIELN